jgi:EAL domain-containing protein (putative c-di-GMP-specific phosphodiesterase class I)
MSNALAQSRPESSAGARHSLCFVVDTDFGYLQGFSKLLRSLGVNTVEFVNSARLGENVENHNPSVVFVNLNATDPYDCLRALFSLRECKFTGRVQLFGRCEPAFLESFRKIGSDVSLTMLPVLQKPIDVAAVRKVILEQKLNTESVSPPDLSLKKAIASNWISFVYQPQVDLKKKIVIGAEAFVRVTHPQHGVLPPARVLGGASEEDLNGLAAQAIASAVKASAGFFNAGVPLKFAININVETLAKLPVAILVEKYRPQDGQWPGLVFDVTETQVLTKTELLKARISGLHQASVSLAVDNFGRGNSSFGIFKELAFSEIKLDRSIIRGCAQNKGDANICKTMVELAHNFGCKASAVGIETREDAQMLAGLGCDNGQGYLFAKPMTEQELMAMVMAARSGPAGVGQPSVKGAGAAKAAGERASPAS